MIEIFKEFIKFLIYRKKYWLMPIFLVLFLFAFLLFVSKGTVIAPFIYTIF